MAEIRKQRIVWINVYLSIFCYKLIALILVLFPSNCTHRSGCCTSVLRPYCFSITFCRSGLKQSSSDGPFCALYFSKLLLVHRLVKWMFKYHCLRKACSVGWWTTTCWETGIHWHRTVPATISPVWSQLRVPQESSLTAVNEDLTVILLFFISGGWSLQGVYFKTHWSYKIIISLFFCPVENYCKC